MSQRISTKLSKCSLLEKAMQIIPPLDGSLHKGEGGRVGIVGGSKDFAGAPFYSSYASLRLGADLAHVICDPSASTVIKTYSPDLMVHGLLSSSQDPEEYEKNQIEFEQLLDRLHVVVLGPGLGRNEEKQKWASWTIAKAIEKRISLVIDADGLWVIQVKPEILRSYPSTVLTPNPVEFQRLLKACSIDPTTGDSEEGLALKLSKALGGCTILQKAPQDIIARENHDIIKIDCAGSPKRCGGQGDILSGLVGAWSAWGKAYFERQEKGKTTLGHVHVAPEEIPLIASVMGSEITRTCARLTFQEYGRSMQSSDMLKFVSIAYDDVTKKLAE
ncbi:HX dehydratase 1 [Phakopsora pachyrhizi]|uniref:ATP-dependent (S)-NAD(P)H-hydrate dehydratase n=1 Tax=Phakopsora pachyrhizi TaxID=170000 RepID=A0AAV0AQ18_PHAPC|nr:HX dehydratase 1 [Phakopsora pachyrhizi]